MMKLPHAAAAVALACMAMKVPECHGFVPKTSNCAFGRGRSTSHRQLYLGEDGEHQAIVPHTSDNESQQDLISSPTSLGSNDSWAAALELKKEMSVSDLDAIFHRQQAEQDEKTGSSLVKNDNDAKDDEALHRSLLKARLEMESKGVDIDHQESVSAADMQFQHISDKLDTALGELEIEMAAPSSPAVEIEAPQEKKRMSEGRLVHFDNGDDDNDDDDDDEEEDDAEDIVEETMSQVKEVSTVIVPPSVKSESKAKKAAGTKPRDEVDDAVAAAVAAVATNRGDTSTSATIATSPKQVNESTESQPSVSPVTKKNEPVEASIKAPTPPKESPPVSATKSSPIANEADSSEDDDAPKVDFWTSVTDSTTKFMDTFTPQESVADLKEQDNNVILETAVSHLSKAAIGFGKAALLTFGASFKAATSLDVADSAQDAASSVSEAVQSISNAVKSGSESSKESSSKSQDATADENHNADIFMETVKGFRTVTTSFGAVGGTFIRSFGRTKQSSEAFEAVTESTKECASFLACMVAFGSKKAASAATRDDVMPVVPVLTMKVEEVDSTGVTDSFATELHVEEIQQEHVESDVTTTSERMMKDEFGYVDGDSSTVPANPLNSVLAFGMAQRERAQELVASLQNDLTAKIDGNKVRNEEISLNNDFGTTTTKKNPLDSLLVFGTKQGERAQAYLAKFAPNKMKEAKLDFVEVKTPLDSVLNFGTMQSKRVQGFFAKLAGKEIVEEEIEVETNRLPSMFALGTKQSERTEPLAASIKNEMLSKFGGVPKFDPVEASPADGLSVQDMRVRIETIKSKIVKKDEHLNKPASANKKNKKKNTGGDDNLFFAKTQ